MSIEQGYGDHLIPASSVETGPQKVEHGAIREQAHITPEETQLLSRMVTETKELEFGANTVKLVSLEGQRAIFKPAQGEVKIGLPLKAEVGSYYKRERAAYLLNKELNLNLVPTTVIRQIDDQIGSLQQYIPDAITGAEAYIAEDNTELLEGLCKLWLFDYLIWNGDRHGANVLIKNRQVHAIDNGLTFGQGNPRTYYDFYQKDIPDSVRQLFTDRIKNQQAAEAIDAHLEPLLEPLQRKACLARLDHIGWLLGNKAQIESRSDLLYSPTEEHRQIDWQEKYYTAA